MWMQSILDEDSLSKMWALMPAKYQFVCKNLILQKFTTPSHSTPLTHDRDGVERDGVECVMEWNVMELNA